MYINMLIHRRWTHTHTYTYTHMQTITYKNTVTGPSVGRPSSCFHSVTLSVTERHSTSTSLLSGVWNTQGWQLSLTNTQSINPSSSSSDTNYAHAHTVSYFHICVCLCAPERMRKRVHLVFRFFAWGVPSCILPSTSSINHMAVLNLELANWLKKIYCKFEQS